jgi:hypothetical protein
MPEPKVMAVNGDSADAPAPDAFSFDGTPQQRQVSCPSCRQEHTGVTAPRAL